MKTNKKSFYRKVKNYGKYIRKQIYNQGKKVKVVFCGKLKLYKERFVNLFKVQESVRTPICHTVAMPLS